MNRSRWNIGLLVLAGWGLGMVPGCRQPTPRADLFAHEVRERIPGLVEAGATDLVRQAPHLVAALRDEDAAVRLFAFQALVRATGHAYGYRYADPESDREAAIQRWEAWLADGQFAGMAVQGGEGAVAR